MIWASLTSIAVGAGAGAALWLDRRHERKFRAELTAIGATFGWLAERIAACRDEVEE